MRHFGQVGDDRMAIHIFAQGKWNSSLGVTPFLRFQEVPHDDLGLDGIWHLNTDRTFAGHRRQYVHIFRLERGGNVVGGGAIGGELLAPLSADLMPTDETELLNGDKFPGIPEMIVKECRDTMAAGRSDIDPRAFLILDDCLYDSAWTRDKSMRYVFMNGRHLLLNHIIISMQYPLGIGPAMRTNIDYVFILRENIMSNRRRIYENYAGMFPTFEFFNAVMDNCTENYEMLVIANNSKSNKLEDQVFWYRSESHQDFKVCCNEFWDMQTMEDERRQMGIVDDDDEENYDEAMARSKKSKLPPLRVKKSSY